MATISRSPGFDFVLTFLEEKELDLVKYVVNTAVKAISDVKENDKEIAETIT